MNFRSVDEVVKKEFYNDFRPTVGMVLIKDRAAVILVQPKKDPSGMSLILPQGGIGEGETIRSALLREAEEELPGIKLARPMTVIGSYKNELPPERHEKSKLMILVSVLVEQMPSVVNDEENTSFIVAYNPQQLVTSIVGARPNKQRLIVEAVREAISRGQLHWDANFEALNRFKAA